MPSLSSEVVQTSWTPKQRDKRKEGKTEVENALINSKTEQ